jgi:hypothetical protein
VRLGKKAYSPAGGGPLRLDRAARHFREWRGGHLELVANFADHTLTVTTTEAA